MAQQTCVAAATARPIARYRDCGEWLDPAELPKYRLVIMTYFDVRNQPVKLTDAQHEQVRQYLRGGGHILMHGSVPNALCGGRRLTDWIGAAYLGDDRAVKGRQVSVVDSTSHLTSHLSAGQNVSHWLMPKTYHVLTRLTEGAKNLVGAEGKVHVLWHRLGKGSVTYVSKDVHDYMKPKGGYRQQNLAAIPNFVRLVRNAIAAGEPSEKPIALVGRRYERVTYRAFLRGELRGQPCNLLRNGSFEQIGDDETPEVWNRMGRRYVEEARVSWRVCREDPVHGRICLRTDDGAAYRFGTTIRTTSFGSYTFSVYLKSSKPDLPCELGLTQYEASRQIPSVTAVRLTTDWRRYTLTAELKGGRNRGRLGPMDFWVAPKGEATVWMDAMQFGPGKEPKRFAPSPQDLSLPPLALPLPGRPAVQVRRAPLQMPTTRAGVVALTVTDDTGLERRSWPVSAGIPLPQSALFDEAHVRLLDPAGRGLPVQTEALSRWVTDGSIRSLFVAFNASVSADSPTNYQLAYGGQARSMQVCDWIEDDGRCIRIDTGPLAFTVQRSPLSLFRRLSFDADGNGRFAEGETLATDHDELAVTGADGTAYTSGLGEVTELRVERAGPVLATVLVRGHHRSKDGRMSLGYSVRITAFRGKSLLAIDHTFLTENAPSRSIVKDICLRLPCGPPADTRAAVGGDGSAVHSSSCSRGQSIALLQTSTEREYAYHVWRWANAARSGRPSPSVGTRRRSAPGQADPSWPKPLATGTKAAGWLARTSGKMTTTVAVEDLWQNHPKEIVAGPEGIEVYLWPRDGVKDLELPDGISKTHRIWVSFSRENDASETGRLLCRQPLLRAEPSWYCSSGVWGNLLHADSETFPAYERLMARPEAMGGYSIESKDRGDLYGMLNYGDSPNSSGWSNLETMDAHALFLSFIRGGRREHFDMAAAAATHYRDVDIVHPVGQTCTHCSNHTFFRHNTSHSWIQGVLDHYLLTGDRRSLEVAAEHAEWLCETPLDAYLREGRKYTRYLDHLLDVYSTVGEPRYLAMFHKKLEHRAAKWREEGKLSLLSPTGQPSTGFSIWYGCDALMKLHQLDSTPEHRELFLRELNYTIDRKRFEEKHAERFADRTMSEEEAISMCLAGLVDNRGNTLLPPLAYAHQLTGDSRFLRIGMLVLCIAGLNQYYFDPLMVMRSHLLYEAKRAGLDADAERQYLRRAQELLSAGATETIANGGFENGTDGWSARRPIEVDRELSLEGRQSLRIPVSDRARWVHVVPPPIRLVPRSVYTFTGYVTQEGQATPGIVISYRDFSGLRKKIGARYTDPDPNSFYSVQIAAARAGSKWRHWTITIETEDGGIASLRLDARQDIRGEGMVWYDAIRLESKPRGQ